VLRLVAFLGVLGSVSCALEQDPERSSPGPEFPRVTPRPGDHELTEWKSADPPIAWRSWSEEAWRLARERDLPVLLYLSTPGGEGTFATGGTAMEMMVEEQFMAIREDPYHRPDLARRYGAGGWPTVALLLPDGRLFAKAVDVPPDNARMYLWRLRGSYEKQLPQIIAAVERAQADSKKRPSYELDINAVFLAAAAVYDDVQGGFGGLRKFPEPAVLEFLLDYAGNEAEAAAGRMVYQTLDHLLASPMVAGGGIAAFSHTPDWRTPAADFDAADQAGILRVLLTAANGDVRYEADARALVAYIGRHLYRSGDGYFLGRRVGYRSAAGEQAWWTDPVPYADRNAVLISACLAAAAQLRDNAAWEMALTAGAYLLDHCVDDQGSVRHTCTKAGGTLSGLLADQMLATEALLDLFEASGDNRYRDAAVRTMTYTEKNHYDLEQRMFVESRPNPGAGMIPPSDYRDGLSPAGNGLAAALYVRAGDLDRAAVLLDGPRLRTAPTRSHATAARALIRLRRAERLQ
jgi:uncharacterized protein YyaL (SSP411 family)